MNPRGNKFLYRILELSDKKILKISSDDSKLLKKLFFDLEKDLGREMEGELRIENYSSTLFLEMDSKSIDIEKKILNLIENRESWEEKKY